MDYTPEELQDLVRQHEREQAHLRLVQAQIAKPKRPGPVPPVPMARLAGRNVAVTLAGLDPVAVKLFVILSQVEKDEFGLIRIERAELAERMGKSISTVALASSQLRAAGLMQRHGRTGYLLRQK